MFQQDNFISSKSPPKTFDCEDAFISSSSAHGKSSCCSLIQNEMDEDKLADCNSSYSLKRLNSFRKKVISLGTIELKLAQYGKNQMEEHSETSEIDQNAEEGSAHPLDSFGDMTDASLISLVKGRNSESMKKESRSLKEVMKTISADSLKTLQGSNGQTHQEHADSGDKINLRDHCTEKPVSSDVNEYLDGLEIGQRCFMGRRDRNKDEETYRHYDALNKPSSECILGMEISPNDVLRVIGEQQFWKARRTIIK